MIVSKWLNSYKTYCLSIAFAHLLVFTYFFPIFVFYTVSVTITFCLFYVWCELINQIETAHRNQLLHLISTTKNEHTRDILSYELYLLERDCLTEPVYDSMHKPTALPFH